MNEKELKNIAQALIQSALSAVDPKACVQSTLSIEGKLLRIGARDYSLDQYHNIYVIGAGKAGYKMALAVQNKLGERIKKGFVNVRHGYEGDQKLPSIEIQSAGHPVPDEHGLNATRRITSLLSELKEDDLVIVLISGGGSALLVQPVETISLEDVQSMTDILLRSGATINEINTIRKHISLVKGGQLAKMIAEREAQGIVLILSDVVGSPLDVIASGPCSPDSTTFQQAYKIFQKYMIENQIPIPIRDYLEKGLKGEIPETPKPGDPIFEHIHQVIIGDNFSAAQAAAQKAADLHLNSILFTSFLEGEASEAGVFISALAKQCLSYGQPVSPPACLILGGETTVTVKGSGKGGRNQELALSAAIQLKDWKDVLVCTLATDGTDGVTVAAGAFVTGNTISRAVQMGMEPYEYLRNNDSNTFFNKLDDLIVTGPTGTNVNDLIFVLVSND